MTGPESPAGTLLPHIRLPRHSIGAFAFPLHTGEPHGAPVPASCGSCCRTGRTPLVLQVRPSSNMAKMPALQEIPVRFRVAQGHTIPCRCPWATRKTREVPVDEAARLAVYQAQVANVRELAK